MAISAVDPLEYDRPSWDCLFAEIDELYQEYPDLTEEQLSEIVHNPRLMARLEMMERNREQY